MRINQGVIQKHHRLHQQAASDISLLKVLYVGIGEVPNDKPIISGRSR